MINKVTLIGNVGKQPEKRLTNNGNSFCNFSVATSDRYKDKNTGNFVDKTEWHNIICFSRIADLAEEFLNKGDKVYIDGKLQTRDWTDKDGNKRYTTEVICQQLQFLTPKKSNDNSPDNVPDDIPF